LPDEANRQRVADLPAESNGERALHLPDEPEIIRIEDFPTIRKALIGQIKGALLIWILLTPPRSSGKYPARWIFGYPHHLTTWQPID
jgi:hypothetical protein